MLKAAVSKVKKSLENRPAPLHDCHVVTTQQNLQTRSSHRVGKGQVGAEVAKVLSLPKGQRDQACNSGFPICRKEGFPALPVVSVY